MPNPAFSYPHFLRPLLLLSAFLLPTLPPAPALAWHGEGHQVIARAGVESLPAEVPVFFRQGAAIVAHVSADPDVFKNNAAPQLEDGEESNHYFDQELLQGKEIPTRRHAYILLCQKLDIKPAKVGYLPYALAESTQRLTLAFAEHRRWPDNPAIHAKALVYAGLLAHYAADLSQPLHCSVHFDGKADPATHKSPRSGIHAKVDHLIEQLQLTPAELTADLTPQPYPALFPAILQEIEASRSHLDQTYALETLLPTPKVRKEDIAPEVRDFALQRARHATQILGNLLLTAWENSEKVELPLWQLQMREKEVQPPAAPPQQDQ